jgi:hypothetical protein
LEVVESRRSFSSPQPQHLPAINLFHSSTLPNISKVEQLRDVPTKHLVVMELAKIFQSADEVPFLAHFQLIQFFQVTDQQ